MLGESYLLIIYGIVLGLIGGALIGLAYEFFQKRKKF